MSRLFPQSPRRAAEAAEVSRRVRLNTACLAVREGKPWERRYNSHRICCVCRQGCQSTRIGNALGPGADLQLCNGCTAIVERETGKHPSPASDWPERGVGIQRPSSHKPGQ